MEGDWGDKSLSLCFYSNRQVMYWGGALGKAVGVMRKRVGRK